MAAGGLIENRVGISTRDRHRADDRERVVVELGDGICLAVARVPTLELRRQRDAMDAGRVRDAPDSRTRLRVDDLDAVSARNEQPMARRIDRQVIPATGTIQRPPFNDRVGRCRRRG
jgi:hypothetical protein